jgi:hypothetical protein
MTVCVHAQRLIPLLYDGELDGPVRREVSNHVANCAACTHTLTMLDRGQELLRQAIDDQIDDIDFSGFWQNVENKLSEPRPAWRDQLRVRWDSWRFLWSWRAPAWAAAASMLFVSGVLLFSRQQPPSPTLPSPSDQATLALADNDQAQIESLSASDTISVWNEPTSNVTVIWVSDEGDGGLP